MNPSVSLSKSVNFNVEYYGAGVSSALPAVGVCLVFSRLSNPSHAHNSAISQSVSFFNDNIKNAAAVSRSFLRSSSWQAAFHNNTNAILRSVLVFGKKPVSVWLSYVAACGWLVSLYSPLFSVLGLSLLKTTNKHHCAAHPH